MVRDGIPELLLLIDGTAALGDGIVMDLPLLDE
jgi:hypothetical protein